MPGIKDHQCVDMVFPFISAFLDKSTRYIIDAELTKVNSLYSDLFAEIIGRRWSGGENFNECKMLLQKCMEELKERTVFCSKIILKLDYLR